MANWRNLGCRADLESGFYGLRAVTLENEKLRVVVLPDKGADIVAFQHKPSDTDFMWISPMGLRNPANSIPTGPKEDGFFLDFYEGAWQEILPSGGPNASYKGADWGLHGETATIPWDFRLLADSEKEIAVEFSVKLYRSPFKLTRVMRLEAGKPVLFMHERLENEGAEAMEYMWGHHPAVGEPWLDESCLVDCPASKIILNPGHYSDNQRFADDVTCAWPMAPAKDGTTVDLRFVPPRSLKTLDLGYLAELDAGWYGVTSTSKGTGFGMAWDKEIFPYVWYWQDFGGGFGYPWYGRTYNLALEPWTSWPGAGLNATIENGTARCLQAGESLETELVAVAYEGRSHVKNISRAGEVELA